MGSLNYKGMEHNNDDVFTSTNDTHLKVKGQGHSNDNERSPRNSSSSSMSGFVSKIPIKVTSATLKSYRHLCNPVSHRTSSQGSDDLEEVDCDGDEGYCCVMCY